MDEVVGKAMVLDIDDPAVEKLITAMVGEMPEFFTEVEIDEILREENDKFNLRTYNEIKARIDAAPELR